MRGDSEICAGIKISLKPILLAGYWIPCEAELQQATKLWRLDWSIDDFCLSQTNQFGRRTPENRS